MENIVDDIVSKIKEKIPNKPTVAIILGSGLSSFAEKLSERIEINYTELPNMPQSNVKGHENKFVCGWLEGKYVIAMLGRIHFYNTGKAERSGIPILIFKKLGVETLIVTNSAGSVNKKIKTGDIVIVYDHINFTGQNPLIDQNSKKQESQFVDMTDAYDKRYIKMMMKIAKKNKIQLKKGVYMQFSGPSYETSAEVLMAKTLGADLVGMSTALEVIVARQCNLKTLCLSVVSNMATGISKTKLTHDEVLQLGQVASNKLHILLQDFLKQI